MSTFRSGWGQGFRGNRTPATIGLIAAIVFGFLYVWGSELNPRVIENLAFSPLTIAQKPWTLLTYPFVGRDALGVIFSCLWLWGIGQVVERELGTPKFLGTWFTFQFLAAGMFLVGMLAVRGPRPELAGEIFASAWVPILAMTVIWATRYPNVEIMFMFVVRIAAKWVALISVAILFFTYPPILAPFVALPLALAYMFAADMLPIRYSQRAVATAAPSKTQVKKEKDYFDKVHAREQERAERERLRKLFESSLKDDPEDKSG